MSRVARVEVIEKTRYTHAAGNDEAEYVYDGLARLVAIEDWLTGTGDGLRYAYDAAGRLASITDYDDSVLSYSYDAVGRVTGMNDYHANATSYAYDDAGRLTSLTAPGSKTWTFGYNALGQRTSQTMPNGMVTEYDYDTRNRLESILHLAEAAGASVEEFAYTLDDAGNIERIDQLDGSYWEYAYDNRYRLTSAVRSNTGGTIKANYSYTYNAADNMTAKTEPFLDDFNDGEYTGWSVTSGSYTAADYYLEATDGANWSILRRSNTDGDIEMSLKYRMGNPSNANERALVEPRYVNANNRLWVYLFGGEARLEQRVGGTFTSLDTNTSITTTADVWYDLRIICDGQDVEVWRGESGGPMEKILDTSSASTSYSTSHLRFQVAPNYEIHFDDVQILSESLSNSVTYAYNSANELTSMTDPNGAISYGYDDWGRMTSKTRGSHSAGYTYAYGHYLQSLWTTFPDQELAGTWYNIYTGGDGKRREISGQYVEKRFRWDAGYTVLSEDDNNLDLVRGYVGRNMAHYGPNASDYQYYMHDHLGSTRALYDGTKAMTAAYEYSPYGALLTSNNATATTRQYTGHDWDPASNLYFAPFRYYGPDVARWTMRDPLHMIDGPNVYGYVGGNPANFVDGLGQYGIPWGPPGSGFDHDDYKKAQEAAEEKRRKEIERRRQQCESRGGTWGQRYNCPSSYCYQGLARQGTGIVGGACGSYIGGKFGSPGGPIGVIIGGFIGMGLGHAFCSEEICCE